MQDLINEEEFLPQKDNYNPWKGFMVFYGIIIICYIIGTYISDHAQNTELSWFLIILFAAIILTSPFVMIFYKKMNLLLPVKTIIIAESLLISIIYCLVMVKELLSHFVSINPDFLSLCLQRFVTHFSYGFFCTCIILLIRNRKLKKLKQQLSSL